MDADLALAFPLQGGLHNRKHGPTMQIKSARWMSTNYNTKLTKPNSLGIFLIFFGKRT